MSQDPVSKLFLSVDITGSTAFKQLPFDPNSPWQKAFLQFYREFPQTLQQIQQADAETFGLKFQLWKPIGDELLFTCVVRSEAEIFHAVRLWIRTMKAFESIGLKDYHKLGVKGAAFLGTFPGPDHESTIPLRPDIEESGRDVVLLNEETVSAVDRDKQGYLFDYFGPSIDTGFRVSSQAKPRYMPVSLEVAYALAAVQNHHYENHTKHSLYKSRDLKLLDTIDLKGVWGEREYPLFALDLQLDDPVHKAVAAVHGSRHENSDILALCAAAYASEGWPCRMYLPDALTDLFRKPPDNPLAKYIENAAVALDGVETEAPDDAGAQDLPAKVPTE